MCCRHSSKDSSEVWTTHLRHGGEPAPVSLHAITEPLECWEEVAYCMWRVVSSALRPSAHNRYPPNPDMVVATKDQGRVLMCIVSIRCSPSQCQGTGASQPLAFHLPKCWDPLAKKLAVSQTSKLRTKIATDVKSLCFSSSLAIFLKLWKRPLHLSFPLCYNRIITLPLFYKA